MSIQTNADFRDDWIDAALRADAVDHAARHLDDEGFTARVMSGLPPAIPALPRWRKPAVAVMWGVAAAGAALALPGAVLEVGREAFRLLAAHPVSFQQIVATFALLGFATWSAAAYALKND